MKAKIKLKESLKKKSKRNKGIWNQGSTAKRGHRQLQKI
jgi:hypothetical protein